MRPTVHVRHGLIAVWDFQGPPLYEAWDSLSFLASTATLHLLASITPPCSRPRNSMNYLQI